MRGSDEQTSGMFSYLSPEQRVRQDHPLRAIRRITDRALRAYLAAIRRVVREVWPAVDCAGKVVAGPAAAGLVHDPQRAPVDEATRWGHRGRVL